MKKMSQKQRNTNKTKSAKKQRKAKKTKKEVDMKNTKNRFVIVDKISGKVSLGGIELFNQFNAGLKKQNDMFLASNNPCYLVHLYDMRIGALSCDEIKSMIDATFICAGKSSYDAWYPSQYALSIASPYDSVRLSIAYYLRNFALGYRYSAKRAQIHLGESQYIDKSERLDDRIENDDSLMTIDNNELNAIREHVINHPLFLKAMEWYEKGGREIMPWYSKEMRKSSAA